VQAFIYVEDCWTDSSVISVQNTGNTETRISDETWENWFNRWLELLQPDLKSVSRESLSGESASSCEIGLRFTGDAEIQEMNAQYREQNKPTDVLTFAALLADFPLSSEVLASMPLYLGDIVISLDTAYRQAQEQQHSLQTELSWLAAHGLLHLLGWDHPDKESELRMLKQQVLLLRSVGITIDLECD
jgi:probable rRNA maturation factor